MSRPPKLFTALNEAPTNLNRIVNVFGLVTDCLEPTPSRGTDWVCTFTLTDGTLNEIGSGLKIRFFRKDPKDLPSVEATGDVVLLLGIKVLEMRGEVMGLSSHGTRWLVFHKANIDRYLANSTSPLEYEQSKPPPQSRSQEELAYAVKLYKELELYQTKPTDGQKEPPHIATKSTSTSIRNESSVSTISRSEQPRSVERSAPKMATSIPAKSQKFSLVQDLALSDRGRMVFVDLCCEVRKLYDDYERINLYVTDYTSNKLLFNYSDGHEEEEDEPIRDGDPYGYTEKSVSKWPGPWGRLTLAITCFDNNSEFVKRNIKVGDYVYLSNVFITMGKNGRLLEGKLRDDTRYPDKLLARKMQIANKEDELQALLRRKHDYSKRYKQSYDKLNNDKPNNDKLKIDNHEIKKRQVPEVVVDDQPPAKKSKKQREKEKKAAKKAAEAAAKQSDPPPRQSMMTLNPNIRLKNIDGLSTIPLSSILSSPSLSYTTQRGTPLTLPFHNVCYKTKLKVLDFYPPSLTNFAAPYRSSDFDTLSDISSCSDINYEHSPPLNDNSPASSQQHLNNNTPGKWSWEWRFTLLVTDPFFVPSNSSDLAPEMMLHVYGADAEYLLNETACDLQSNPATVSRIREKLFHLWGDLEEVKEANLKKAVARLKPSDEEEGEKEGGEGEVKAQGGMPFECFIKEYGIPIPPPKPRKKSDEEKEEREVEYDRTFQLFGVSINA